MDAMYPPREGDRRDLDGVPSYDSDAGWHWHDAALIVFERHDAGRQEYAVGAVDLYANAMTGDLGGSYLELGAYDNLDRAADHFDTLQSALDAQMLLPFQLADYLNGHVHERTGQTPEWRSASPTEYAAYEVIRSLDVAEPAVEADYHFALGVTEDGEPALQAVKQWLEDGEPRQARRTLDTFGMSDEAAVLERELNLLYRTEGVEPAMALAAQIASASGHLQREGEALFSDGPADAFTSDRTADPVQQFQDAFADGNARLLEPVDPAVNYSFDVTKPDPYTLELRANKWWIGEDGALQNAGVTLNSYSLESFEFEREIEREIAAIDREGLEQTHAEEGLEASMRRAEALAIAHGDIDPAREDGRLFFEGPEDRFTTLRELQLAGHEHEVTVSARDEWQELLDRPNNDQPDPEPHYWLMQHRPVETPDGEALGVALVIIEFPQLTPDFGAHLEEHGMDESLYPTEARRLEIAHFPDEAASRKFEAEFQGYLVPDILDGPELAPEVAKLEGLPGMWEPLRYSDIAEHMKADHAIVKNTNSWHLHNPNAEQEVQGQFQAFDFDL